MLLTDYHNTYGNVLTRAKHMQQHITSNTVVAVLQTNTDTTLRHHRQILLTSMDVFWKMCAHPMHMRMMH